MIDGSTENQQSIKKGLSEGDSRKAYYRSRHSGLRESSKEEEKSSWQGVQQVQITRCGEKTRQAEETISSSTQQEYRV